MFEVYIAQNLWDIDTCLRSLGGQENEAPQYVTLIYPDTTPKEKLTAAQIKQRVLEGLR